MRGLWVVVVLSVSRVRSACIRSGIQALSFQLSATSKTHWNSKEWKIDVAVRCREEEDDDDEEDDEKCIGVRQGKDQGESESEGEIGSLDCGKGGVLGRDCDETNWRSLIRFGLTGSFGGPRVGNVVEHHRRGLDRFHTKDNLLSY